MSKKPNKRKINDSELGKQANNVNDSDENEARDLYDRPKISKLKIVIYIVLAIIVVTGAIAVYMIFIHRPSVKPSDATREVVTDTSDNEETSTEDFEIIDPSFLGEDDVTDPTAEHYDASMRKKEFYNILVVGRDSTSASTDVIMLVSFDVTNNSASIMQIPRDTYVKTEKASKKINAQYAYGSSAARAQGLNAEDAKVNGVKNLANAVKRTLGVPVDRYIFMDLTGFKNIVDIVGGVQVDIPFNMKYDDPYQNLHINLPQGLRTLNGNEAEQFVRYRKNNDGTGYIEGDIGRIKAQKIFLSALTNKMIKSNVAQMTKLADQIIKYVKTDCSASDMVYFATRALNLNTAEIRFHTLPGEGQYINGVSYYVIHREDTLKIINQYYNPLTFDITADKTEMVLFTEYYPGNIDEQTVDTITDHQPKIPRG